MIYQLLVEGGQGKVRRRRRRRGSSESLTSSQFTHFELDHHLRYLPWVNSRDLSSRFTQQNYVW
jgi:hypothetical protein